MEPPTQETGEWRIKILCPNKPIVPDPAYPDDPHKRIDIVTSYSIGHVYDILQTEGEPLPKPPRPEVLTARSEAGSSLYRRLERYATDQGVRVIHQDTGSANGWYVLTKREIAEWLVRPHQARDCQRFQRALRPPRQHHNRFEK
jgi:hypothetical protein